MNRKRLLKLILAGTAALATAIVAHSGDLVPATVGNSCYRTVSGVPLSGTFTRGTTLLLTNWVAYSDASGTATQDLTDITIDVTIGTASGSTSYTATAESPLSAGRFYCLTTVATNTTAAQQVQITLTDTGQTPNVSYSYPWYSYITKAGL